MPHIYQLDETASRTADEAARLAAEKIAPNAVETDRLGTFPTTSLAALRQAGWLGLTLPAEIGGRGQGPGAFAAVVEAIAEACPSTAMIYVMHVSAVQALVASTSLADRDSILREVAAGRHLTTLAFSERGSRSQFWAPVSQLERNGEGFRVNAHKSWVTSANHADSHVSSVQQPGATNPSESTLFLLSSHADGVKTVATYDGLGLRGNDSAPVEYTDVAVAAGDLLTEQGAAMSTMLEIVLPWFVVGTSAMANGICRAATAATAQHLVNTEFQNDHSKLRDLPNLRSRLAEMHLCTEQSRAILGYTVQCMAQPDELTPLYVLQSRNAALQAASHVTDLAMKACGGAAFSKQLGIERLFRDARAGWVMAPTVDHLRDFVGRALTGLPLFDPTPDNV